MEIYSYTGACDYLISDRKTPPQYVKTATQNARGDLEYTFTSDVAEAARFDRTRGHYVAHRGGAAHAIVLL